MKRTLGFLLASVASLSAAAPVFAKVQVVTSLQDFASITDAVGGKRVETFALARGYQDPHFVEPKPSFVLKLSKADLLIVAGLELEVGYLPPLIDQSRNAKIRPGSPGYLDASAGCDILERPTGTVTRAMGDVHPFGNPHYWLDPENGRIIARAIAARLKALDASGAAEYDANLAAFEAKLTEGAKRWEAALAPYAGTELVTYHNSWPNFLKRFKLVAAAYVEPKPGVPPSPAHTVELIDMMRAKKIPVILMEPYFDRKTPAMIAEKTGATLLIFIPSVGGLPQITDYFALFDYDVKLLADALAAKKDRPMTVLEILLPAFVAGLILTGIHSYLGVHVVERGVIFVDLSLAQIAALGTTVAFFGGFDVHSELGHLFALTFTVVGAAIFAFVRPHSRTRVPQEAVIGIVYAVAAAASILVMSKSTRETEHLKDMLVGNILSVSWPELRHTAFLYALIGIFHYFARRRFLLISMNEPEAVRQGLNVRFWDFLFYVSFGVVVTSSVPIAGVLLVFCYLIVPSVTAMLFATRLGPRLAIGWTMGAVVSALGVGLSFLLDLPTGATIVATFGAALLLLSGVRLLVRRPA